MEEYSELINWLQNNKCLTRGKLSAKNTTKENIILAKRKIKETTSFLPTETSITYRLRVLFQGINKKNILCPVCGNLRSWGNIQRGFEITCKNRDQEHKNFINQNKQKLYKKTCLEKYGDEVPGNTKLIQDKKKKTCLKNWGVEHSSQSATIQSKIEETMLIRYGVRHSGQSKILLEKMYKTNLKRYGFKIVSKANGKNLNNLRKLIRDKYSLKIVTDENIKQFLKETYLNSDSSINNDKMIKDLNCHNIYSTEIFNKFKIPFKHKKGRSRFEDQTVGFIETLDPQTEIITNSRKILSNGELDIYLPEYNLAIEINGLAFHSEGPSKWSAINNLENNPEKHLYKFNACKEQGIELLQVFNELATFEHLAFEKLLAFKMGKLKWPTGQRWYPAEIIYDLLNGWPEHLLEMGYKIQEQLPPEEHWFNLNTKRLLEEGNFKEGHRKFYDCGYLRLTKN